MRNRRTQAKAGKKIPPAPLCQRGRLRRSAFPKGEKSWAFFPPFYQKRREGLYMLPLEEMMVVLDCKRFPL
jgi:hypothetical protein